jgi:hypothetical protein
MFFSFKKSFPNLFFKSITQQIEEKDYHRALFSIQSIASSFRTEPLLYHRLMALPALDALCLRIGKEILIPHRCLQDLSKEKLNSRVQNLWQGLQKTLPESNIWDKKPRKRVLYLATQLYTSGGHTGVIEDFIRLQDQKDHFIILTNLVDEGKKELVKKRFDQVPLLFLSQKNYPEKIKDLHDLWEWINPHQVFLFNHPHDPLAIATAQPFMKGDLFFYHHADYLFSLGAALPWGIHLDITPERLACCKTLHGSRAMYTPLTKTHPLSSCQQPSYPLKNHEHTKKDKKTSFGKQENIHTATIGNGAKVFLRYPISYATTVSLILSKIKGTHTHIGNLAPKQLHIIFERLKQQNIDPQRFQYIPQSVSLMHDLRDIDLYIASFPLNGWRTLVEVMASGLPIINHQHIFCPYLTDPIVYPEALIWKNLQELEDHLDSLTPELLKNHKILARQHYETFFHPHHLQQQLKSDFHTIAPMPETKNLGFDQISWIIDSMNIPRKNPVCAKYIKLYFNESQGNPKGIWPIIHPEFLKDFLRLGRFFFKKLYCGVLKPILKKEK